LKPKIVEKTKRYYKIEILPNVVLRVPKSNIRTTNGKAVAFKNPLSGLTCVALFE